LVTLRPPGAATTILRAAGAGFQRRTGAAGVPEAHRDTGSWTTAPGAVTHALVDVELELLLRDALLDPLAEGGVPGRAAAALPVLDQAAALPVERRRRRPVVAVLLGAEAIHPVVAQDNQHEQPKHTEIFSLEPQSAAALL